MGAGDILIVQGVKFSVLKRESHRILVQWSEAFGIYKERWIIYKGVSK